MSDPSDSQGIALMIMCISLLVICAGSLIGITSFLAFQAKVKKKETSASHTPDMVSK